MTNRRPAGETNQLWLTKQNGSADHGKPIPIASYKNVLLNAPRFNFLKF